MLVNLLHNAVKFSPEGGDVTIRVRSDGEEVVVSVEDHGIGIPKSAQARIFERFYKVDRARVRGGGTGLGLSIARHVVEGHSGRIWAESEEGAGFDVLVRNPGRARPRRVSSGPTLRGAAAHRPQRRSPRLTENTSTR